ncbi:MAG: hydrogenase-4 component E [Chloroflexi bacterium]|nr:hydrogenase-4 component E [Chloroflexota bacterium]
MTGDWLDLVLAALIGGSLLLLAVGKLTAIVRLVAAQGVLIALVPVLAHWGEIDAPLIAVAGGNLIVKAVAFPWLLSWTAKRVRVNGHAEPRLNYSLAVVAGIAFLLASLWLGSRLEPPGGLPSSLAVPAALFMIMAGLFLIVTRRTALTQVAGYLIVENGIFTFGTAVAWEYHVVVELGVLLDVFAALFVMGITVFQMGRTFESLDVGEMAQLSDRRRPARDMSESDV